MNLSYVDLHCHSTASDGSLPPAEVVRLARRNGLTGLALTDHDTVAGNAEAAAEAAALKIDFLPGIEISAEMPHPGTLHLLGYGIDPESPSLKNLTTELLAGRDDRNPRMVKKLNDLGVAVSMKEWEDEAKGGVLGRPHLAAILVRKGYVSSNNQAFDKYLAPGGLAHVDKERLPSSKAIELIRQSGGVCVLAHAFQLKCENEGQLNLVVKNLVDQGLVRDRGLPQRPRRILGPQDAGPGPHVQPSQDRRQRLPRQQQKRDRLRPRPRPPRPPRPVRLTGRCLRFSSA